MDRATGDFITFAEVQKSIDGALGEGVVTVDQASSKAYYTNIWITATIEDGKITEYVVAADFAANMKLKVGISVNGTGSAYSKATYNQFKY